MQIKLCPYVIFQEVIPKSIIMTSRIDYCFHHKNKTGITGHWV